MGSDAEAEPGTAASREVVLSFGSKRKNQRKLPLFRRSGPRLRGCTPLRTPKWKSEVSAAKRTQYYCPFLTPPSLPPLLSRVFPRTPAVFNGCCFRDGLCFKSLLCRGGIYAARN